MNRAILIMAAALMVGGCAAKQDAPPKTKPLPIDPRAAISEKEYRQVEQRILSRIAKLKTTHASLRDMASPSGHEHNVTWALHDPTKKARRAVFGEGGYWFSLKFYRGRWGGAAAFRPIEFGDLKLWFRYGHAGNASVIAAMTTILREENEAFCRKHPQQRPNQSLRAHSRAAAARYEAQADWKLYFTDWDTMAVYGSPETNGAVTTVRMMKAKDIAEAIALAPAKKELAVVIISPGFHDHYAGEDAKRQHQSLAGKIRQAGFKQTVFLSETSVGSFPMREAQETGN